MTNILCETSYHRALVVKYDIMLPAIQYCLHPER